MANPALIVRVAATIAELKANLAEGRSQIETTTAAMGKLAASFSGDKLIQAAQNVTAAVNQIGGASKLTEAEQARVNATLEKALEKYRLLGREAPAGMQQLADETRGADKASGGLSETVKSLALGFAAMFTARAAFNFIKSTIDEAGALQDLSQQTRISVEELQVMAGAMSEFGVEQEDLGKALFKLSQGIAGGDESVTHGLHVMGLSLKDVAGLNGKDLFLKIESGLATLQGGLRDSTAADLFGGKLGAAMAGASEGIEGTIEKWQELNHVASAESVAALDEFGESIARTQASLSAMATNMAGPIAQGFNTLFDSTQKGATNYQIFAAMTQDLIERNMHLGTGTEHLAALLDGLNKKTEENKAATEGATGAHQAAVVVLDARSQAVKFMAALEADAAKALSASQIANLEHLKDIGQLNAKNAEGIGISAGQYAKYTAAVAEATKALQEQDRYTKMIGDYKKEQHKALLDDLKAQMSMHASLAAVVNANIQAELDAQIQLNAAHGLDAQGRLKVATAIGTVNDALDALHAKKSEGISQAAQEQVITDEFLAKELAIAKAVDLVNAAMGKTPASITPVAAALDKTKVAADAAVEAFGKFSGMQFPTMGTAPGSNVPGGGGGGVWTNPYNIGAALGGSAPIHVQRRATGGPVSAGQPYMVGERGPELFTPGSSGGITPNGGGGTTIVNVHITQPLGTPAEIVRVIGPAVMQALRNSGQRLPVGA